MTKKEKTFNEQTLKEAQEIMGLYQFYQLDGDTYLSSNSQAINDLFDAVVLAIHSCTVLKAHLPHQEFIHPSSEVLKGDAGWVGHFEELDNRRFFLSDIHDFLRLYFGKQDLYAGI